MQDYWWVTRPKRKLNSVPEELAAFCSVALGKQWNSNREAQKAFEVELENTGTKRIGERRDASGSGGRTHASMLFSLGLWFEKDNKVFLTLAGEAIMDGRPLVQILKKQVLRFQYPSSYSETVKVTSRFKIRPFIFLLKLLSDNRIQYLKQEEIAYIVCINAEKEDNRCYENVVNKILQFRSFGESVFSEDYFISHKASKSNLMDVANTIMNWLDYTQLVYRETKTIGIDVSHIDEVNEIINNPPKFIEFPCESDVFQRKYGVDPWHQKDTRNILNTTDVSSKLIDKNRIIRAFFNYSSLKPISKITLEDIQHISQITGTDEKFTENVLMQTYPNGAIGGYLVNYRNMAFQGREEARDFEIATANLFRDVFHYKATQLGQSGSKSTPDVLLISDFDGYQAIIDNKAYSKYSISGDHHNRMVHNYIEKIGSYSECNYPIGFFTYISGGFCDHIDDQIKKEVDESGVHGSGITVSTLISLVEDNAEHAYSHFDLRKIFGVDRQVVLSDFEIK